MSEYELRGASAAKPDVRRAIAGLDEGLYPGAFCKVVADVFGGDPEACLALHADGAGSKSAVAYLTYRRHADPKVFRGIAQDSLVMNLDDLLCVGATGPFVLSNTIGRNAKLIAGDVIRELIAGYEACIAELDRLGISIVSCGGETADLGDLARTVIVDSTLAVRMRRQDVVDAADVRPGHVIVGLASFGKASYEVAENSGIGTNGFTAARHLLLSSRYRDDAPETFAPEIGERAYTGRFDLDDRLTDTMTVGDALLSPTRTYAPIVIAALRSVRRQISAMFHNSGGGLTKCLRFGSGVHYVKDHLFATPPVFSLIRKEGRLPFGEMCQTFNMGHRFEVVCSDSAAEEVIHISRSFGVDAQVIGRVERTNKSNLLTIRHGNDSAEFSVADL